MTSPRVFTVAAMLGAVLGAVVALMIEFRAASRVRFMPQRKERKT